MQNRRAGRAVASILLSVIIATAAFIFLSSVFEGVLAILGADSLFEENQWSYMATSLLAYVVTMLPAVVLAVRFARIDNGHQALSALLPGEKMGAGKFCCAVLSCYVFCLAGNIISAMLESVAYANALPVPSEATMITSGGGMLLVQILMVGVLPALTEELVIRGSVYCFCRQTGPFFCGLLSGLVFALFHCNFAQYPTAFMFGFITGYYVCVYRNIWISIAAHFINNLIVCLYNHDGGELYFALTDALYALFVAASIVCFAVMLIKYRLFRERTESSSEGFFKILTEPLMIVCIGVYIAAAFLGLFI